MLKKSTSKNTSGTSGGSPPIPEQTTLQVNEQQIQLYQSEELKRFVQCAVCECHCNIKNLQISVVPSKTYIGNGEYLNIYYLTVHWDDGVSESKISTVVEYAISDYVEYTFGKVDRAKIIVNIKRIFTDSVILQASRKYANCISPNLPLNTHNMHCYKIGGVPIYELAVGELSLLDEVK